MIAIVLMLVTILIHAHGKGDGMSYIELESSVIPKTNTTYGEIQILNEITIEFNLICHPYNDTDDEPHSIQNIFHLQSTVSSESSSIYCSQYPSLWFTPIDNTLYFSLLNDVYCMETLAPLTPNVPYQIKMHYDESSVYIAINNDTLIEEAHNLQFHALNHNTETLTLWISDSFSDAAPVTLYDLHMATPVTIQTAKDPPKTIVSYVQTTKYRNTHPNTIFIIEIAVLSVFAFACLGVLIASLCLLKMRRSARSKKRYKVKPEGVPREVQVQHATKLCASKQKQQKYNYNKVVHLKQIVSNSSESRQSDDGSGTVDILSAQSPLQPHSATTAITESQIDKDISTDGVSTDYSTHSKGRYYVEALSPNANHLGIDCHPIHKHSYLHQIPSYNSNSKTAASSNNIGAESFEIETIARPMHAMDRIAEPSDKYKNLSVTIAESPQLPQSPKRISMDAAIISDIYASHVQLDGNISTRNDLDTKSIDAASNDGDAMSDMDAYDLNSEEGDDIKLRRAALQSQRAVMEAFNLDVEPFEAPCDDAEDERGKPMDGAPVIESIYDTIHCKHDKTLSVSRSDTGGSSEDMFTHNNTDMNTDMMAHNPSNHLSEIASGPESSVAGIAGSGNVSIGPSLPSLATDAASNRYSTFTNVTYLTNATKRLLLPTSEDIDCKTTSSMDNRHSSHSSDDDLSSFSSGNESACITMLRGKRKSTTVSALSMAVPSNMSYSDYSSSGNNIQLSKSKSLSDNHALFEYEFKANKSMKFMDSSVDDTSTLLTLDSAGLEIHEPLQQHQISSSMIVGRIKLMREKYSMGYQSKSDDISHCPTDDTQTVSFQNLKSLSSLHMKTMSNTVSNTISFDRYKAATDRVNIKSAKGMGRGDSVSKGDRSLQQRASTETSAEDEKLKEFEWIRDALQSCDENGWDGYYQNFKTHKVNESRLPRLDDVDWRELIPAIGPRNDFKDLWRRRQMSNDTGINQAVV